MILRGLRDIAHYRKKYFYRNFTEENNSIFQLGVSRDKKNVTVVRAPSKAVDILVRIAYSTAKRSFTRYLIHHIFLVGIAYHA